MLETATFGLPLAVLDRQQAALATNTATDPEVMLPLADEPGQVALAERNKDRTGHRRRWETMLGRWHR